MIERSMDYRRIKKLVNWPLAISSEVIYLIEKIGDKDEGLWSFFKRDDNSYLIHGDMKPEFRGKKAIESGKAAFRWIFENTGVDFIKAEIEKDNMKACHAASWSGMKNLGTEGDFRHFKIKR